MALRKLQSPEDWEPYLGQAEALYLNDNLTVPQMIELFKTEHEVHVT